MRVYQGVIIQTRRSFADALSQKRNGSLHCLHRSHIPVCGSRT